MAAYYVVIAIATFYIVVVYSGVDVVISSPAINGIGVVAGTDRVIAGPPVNEITSIVLVGIAGAVIWVCFVTSRQRVEICWLVVGIIRERIDTCHD